MTTCSPINQKMYIQFRMTMNPDEYFMDFLLKFNLRCNLVSLVVHRQTPKQNIFFYIKLSPL